MVARLRDGSRPVIREQASPAYMLRDWVAGRSVGHAELETLSQSICQILAVT